MEDKWKPYRDAHLSKIKLGVIASVLIGCTFGAMFLGLLKVQAGVQSSDPRYLGYLIYPRVITINGNPELLAYTTFKRQVDYQYNDINGMDDGNGIIMIDSSNGGKPVITWNFSLSKPHFIIGTIEYITQGNYSDPVSPVVFVQFAQVDTAETILWNSTQNGKVTSTTYVRNQTGYYESYLLNITSSTAPVIKNLTAQLAGRRVERFVPLSYNPADTLPDFLLLTSNLTWQAENLNGHWSSINYKFHAYYADGTSAWNASDDVASSILYTTNHGNWYNAFSITRLDVSHYIMPLVNNSLIRFNIQNGSRVGPVLSGTGGSFYWATLSSTHDYNHDGILDVLVGYHDSPENKDYITCISGNNGTLIGSFGRIPINSSSYCDLQNVQKFGGSSDPLFVSWNRTSLAFIQAKSTGFVTIASIQNLLDTPGTNFYPRSIGIFSYHGQLYYACQISGQSQGSTVVIDISNNKVLFTSSSVTSEESVYGEIVPAYSQMQLATIQQGQDGFTLVVPQSKGLVYQFTSENTLLFYACIAGACISGVVLVIMSRAHLRRRIKKETIAEKSEDDVKEVDIRRLRKISAAIILVLIFSAAMVIYFLFIQNSEAILFDSGNYKAQRAAYLSLGLVFASMPVLSILYNHLSPRSSMLFVKFQGWIFKQFIRGKDYRVVVLNMDAYSKRYSFSTILMRSIFPLLVSLTAGLAMFQAFSTEPIAIAGNFNVNWVSDFELYAGIAFTAIYIVLILLIPGAWLLDDAGVVYFNEPKNSLSPGDISKISDWLLNMLKGVFGFTALLNYYNMFKNLPLTSMISINDPVQSILMLVFVIVIYLILSPILYGFSTMFLSNASMLDDIEYNKHQLYARLEKAGMDVKPRRLRDFLESSNEP